MVTVALRSSSRNATGLPTRSERPTTTASAPSSATEYESSNSITPSGVHGRSPGAPCMSRPALTWVRPSTSLSASISAVSSLPFNPFGTGSWSRIPLTSGLPLHVLDHRRDLVLARVGRKVLMEVDDPRLGTRLALVRHVHRGRGVVPDQDRGQAGGACRCARGTPPRRAPPRRGPARQLPCRR